MFGFQVFGIQMVTLLYHQTNQVLNWWKHDCLPNVTVLDALKKQTKYFKVSNQSHNFLPYRIHTSKSAEV